MEGQQENSTDQHTDIQELKMEENKLTEDSVEDDILGTQSLLMSDSDESNDSAFKGDISLQNKTNSRKRTLLLDSGEDDCENEQPEGKTYEEGQILNKKRISSLIDSDSDFDQKETNKKDDPPNILPTGIEFDVKAKEYAKDNLRQLKNLKWKKKTKQRTKTERRNSSNSDSDSLELSKKSKNINYNFNAEDKTKELKETKRISSLVDSESSNAESETESDLKAAANERNLKAKDEQLKVVRASAKKAMDEMQAIQSEQQRLHREAYLSIPYHKPRKHTLDEFLKRRTILQPQIASPVTEVIQTRSLKMTSEELEEYAKLMEERAKEATEFFKPESENEEEADSEDNECVLDKPAVKILQNDANIYKQLSDSPIEIAIKESNETDEFTPNLDGLKKSEEEFQLLAEENQLPQVEDHERPTFSKLLITEVIELPKLDMNTVRISPVKKHTPRLSLNIKQLLTEKNLSRSPSLSGDPNKLIDLETGDLLDKQPDGMENLMKRLMSTVKARKSKNSQTCNILSVENGKLEMSKVNISRTETKDVQQEAKPGAAYFELKKNLKEIIKQKRLQEINKKQVDEVEYSKCLEDEEDDNYEIEDENDEMSTDEIESVDKSVMVDEEENALVAEVDRDNNDLVEISGDQEDAKNNVEDGDDTEEEDEEEEEENDVDNTEFIVKSQRKNRIIKTFEDTDEEVENDDIDFLKTQAPTTQPFLMETQATVKVSLGDEQIELMALCSGTFDKSQKTSGNALMSQIPLTQSNGKPVNDEELLELCSGTFELPSDTTQPPQSERISENRNTKCNKILSSDEENDGKQLSPSPKTKQRVKKYTKKLRQKKAKLGFSDDEDEEGWESDYTANQMTELEDVNLEIAAEEPETFVDYDSEENEILVQLTKKDKVKQAENFFEKEAELSESEWGSADEDENNLDNYDIELGDEDEFDRGKLQTELGQIHARKMLDEDIREVRKIQEMLFEDEELDGVGRQRTFKWKNAESGFSLDDGRSLNETGEGHNDDSGDEINEHNWRKIRYEREQFLKEQGCKPESQYMSTVLPTNILQLNSTVTSTITTKNVQIITAKKTSLPTSESKQASPFLISKAMSAKHKKTVRGSFLVRDKETLNKLAGLTKGTSSSITVSGMDDTVGTVSIKSIKPKNFVFATLTNEEHENLKRKADDSLNSSNENGKNFLKKPKLQSSRVKCFIDQLL